MKSQRGDHAAFGPIVQIDIAVMQAREFSAAVGVTGIVLTKLDGTARGGVILSIADEFDIPVKLIGIGEGVDDLRDFDPTLFVEALFGELLESSPASDMISQNLLQIFPDYFEHQGEEHPVM